MSQKIKQAMIGGFLAACLAACGGSQEPEQASVEPLPDVTQAAETDDTTTADPQEPVATEVLETDTNPETPTDTAQTVTETVSDVEDTVAQAISTVGETVSAEILAEYAALSGDPVKGRRLYAQCRSCHALTDGDNLIGPTLYNIIGREAGILDGVRYSRAMTDAGIVWTEATLFAYLQRPSTFMPGTTMAYPGMRRAQDRADVIAYLKSEQE